MNIIDILKNNFFFGNKYKTHSEAVIISCYLNPTKNPYRLKAFNSFYESIKHLNHKIIECVIDGSQPELPSNENIKRVNTKNLLWHKEALLNNIVKDLNKKFKYVFWLDADILFTNNNWLVDAVNELEFKNIVQPFEYCVHLEKDELKPSFNPVNYEYCVASPNKHPNMWRSFCANIVTSINGKSEIYDVHGHVGFAWGARREILELVPLYDKALVGGADHIIAHAAAGQIPHKCITKSFTDDLSNVLDWSRKFYSVVGGSIGYVEGYVYHIWHGDLKDRQYLKRAKEFTKTSKTINQKDENGLHVTNDDSYVRNYFAQREIVTDDGFIETLAVTLATDDPMIGLAVGGNIEGAIIGELIDDATQPASLDIDSTNMVDDGENNPLINENFS
jgi:hypothetical protein